VSFEAKPRWSTALGTLALIAAGCTADSTEIPDADWLNKSIVSNSDAVLEILPADVKILLSETDQPDSLKSLVSCVGDELAMKLDAGELATLVSSAKDRNDFSKTGWMALSLYPNEIREASEVCADTLFVENSKQTSNATRTPGPRRGSLQSPPTFPAGTARASVRRRRGK
jgi:hypothetical protein